MDSLHWIEFIISPLSTPPLLADAVALVFRPPAWLDCGTSARPAMQARDTFRACTIWPTTLNSQRLSHRFCERVYSPNTRADTLCPVRLRQHTCSRCQSVCFI
jgi:hypothetical protein